MHGRWSHMGERAVMMLLIVPMEQLRSPLSCVLQTPKTGRTAGSVLERPKLRLGVRIVVAGMRTEMRLLYAQIRKQQSDSLGAHGGAAIRMQSELSGPNSFSLTSLCNE